MKITSRQNDKVKYWVSLHDKKNRDRDKCFLIEGDHLINEAKKRNLIIDTISLEEDGSSYTVTKDVMEKISLQKTPCAKMALVKYIPSGDIFGNVLILDCIQDPGNLGTIIRSAVAFNFKTIILGDDCVDIYNPKVVRSTEGMLFNINIIRTNLKEIIPELKKNGYSILATDVRMGSDIRNIEKNKIALIIGSEGQGVKSDIKEMADTLINIKISNLCESLNASIAASILMYEVNHE